MNYNKVVLGQRTAAKHGLVLIIVGLLNPLTTLTSKESVIDFYTLLQG